MTTKQQNTLLSTQPNMNDHSRSINMHTHTWHQTRLPGRCYEDWGSRGVASADNTSDILTKNLQPHLHQKHCTHLHLSTHKKKDANTRTKSMTNSTLRLTSFSRQKPDTRSNDRNPSHRTRDTLANSKM
jgi:hypothetical protein